MVLRNSIIKDVFIHGLGSLLLHFLNQSSWGPYVRSTVRRVCRIFPAFQKALWEAQRSPSSSGIIALGWGVSAGEPVLIRPSPWLLMTLRGSWGCPGGGGLIEWVKKS